MPQQRTVEEAQKVVESAQEEFVKEGGVVHEDAMWDASEMALDGVSTEIIARTLREGWQRPYQSKGGWTTRGR